jgi:F-type H+-transporting ATPase subunit b
MKFFFRVAGFVTVLFFASIFFATMSSAAVGRSAPASAQSTPSQPNAAAQSSAADPAAGIVSSEAPGKKEDKKEAAAEDATAQFKQSASVRWLGQHLGLTGAAMYWFAVVLNFAIIALGVVYFSRLHLPTMFRNRTESIRKAMDEAKKTSDDAKQRLSGIEARLSHLDLEIAAMRAQAEQNGADEEARIRASAEEDRKKIVEAAGQEIDVAAKSARRDLAAYAADLAVNLARQRIQVDVPADQALVGGFAASLGKATQ